MLVISSPVLFSIFIDLVTHHLRGSYHLYAHDLQMFIQSKVADMSFTIDKVNKSSFISYLLLISKEISWLAFLRKFLKNSIWTPSHSSDTLSFFNVKFCRSVVCRSQSESQSTCQIISDE